MSYPWDLTSLLSLLQAHKHVLQSDCTQPMWWQWWWPLLWWHMLTLAVLCPLWKKEGDTNHPRQGCGGWWTSTAAHSHVCLSRAPGYGSICRVKWPLCRVNTWAAGFRQLPGRETSLWCEEGKQALWKLQDKVLFPEVTIKPVRSQMMLF